MNDPYILLWLEGPLQSWGHDSKFGRRDSLDFPTKSGILGLLCCARGADGEQAEWLAPFTSLDMKVSAFAPKSKNGRQPIHHPLLCDFHMVGSGYDEKDPWETLHIPKKEDGGKAVGGGTKMTYRYYVQDMAYAVALQIPISFQDDIVTALQRPVWDLYLGRKCCVPTEFIFQGVFSTVDSADEAAKALAETKNRSHSFQVIQGDHYGELFTLNDMPIRFGPRKAYRDRRVTIVRADGGV